MITYYIVQWTETNRRGEFVTKERTFKSETARTNFLSRLEDKPNFMRVERYAEEVVR